MRLVVTDAAGRAVRGAAAAIPGSMKWTASDATPVRVHETLYDPGLDGVLSQVAHAGHDGILVLPAGGAADTAWVAAPGFRMREARIAPTGESPSPLVLERSTMLRVRVDGRSGWLPRAIVRVSAAGHLREDGEAGVALLLRRAIGGSPLRRSTGDAGAAGVREFSSGHSSEVWIPWVAAGVPIGLAAFDALGEPLASGEVRLDPGEDRTVTLRAESAPRSARFLIRDDERDPVEGATVYACSPAALGGAAGPLGHGGCVTPPVESVTTGPDGRAVFEWVHSRELAIVVDAPGFQTQYRRAVALPEEDAEVCVDLRRSTDLALRARDRAGTLVPLADDAAWAEVDDPEFWLPPQVVWLGRPRIDGTTVIRGLPWAEVTLSVSEPGGNVTRTRADSRRGYVEVTLE
jgi:hypothetical protein